MKKYLFLLVFWCVCILGYAQNKAISDAIDSDSTFSPKDHITQIPLENS